MRFILITVFFILQTKLAQSINAVIKNDTTVIHKINPSNDLEKNVFSEVNLDFAKKAEDIDLNLMQRFINWLSHLLFGDSNIENAHSTMKLFFWIFIIVGVGLIIWLLTKIEFTRYFKRNAKTNAFNFTDIEEDITGINFSDKIKTAISESNFRLAIRWQYLKQLSVLNEKQYIIWQAYKTNIDYSNELAKTNYQSQFKELSKIYDYAWYGEYPISALKYDAIEKQFTTFEKLLNV